ncbi:hypothetical protein PYW07_011287 [Mythimna separata]|uniref:Uncharacterized protein n=1 Tax=Mythimna separata TaxID=271217 RepID=A0AAD8DLV3_MYTSE|nr:hypothetical protein PYW07_011287 [Mythimna separata]
MGIPQHYGLLYSMGLGLVMEGLLSGCYHLCPNKMNFQFDSSFMYVIAVIVMIKLYQNRHSDIIPSAHTTFMIIAFVMTLGLFGILFPSVLFSVLFTILHMLTCFVLTLKIYYAGKFKLEWSAVTRGVATVRADRWRAALPAHRARAALVFIANIANWTFAIYRWRAALPAHRARAALVFIANIANWTFAIYRWRAALPAHRARAALVFIANIANWTFAIYSAIVHNKDFARQLLAILMGNAILYTMFYIIMKLVHRERIAGYTWFYFVLAHVAWFTALKLFLDSRTKWSVSTMFYIIMKLVHRERIAGYTWFYFVLAHVAWFTALKLFLDSRTKWSVSTMFYIIMKLVHRERIAGYTWFYFVLAHVAWFTALKLFLDSRTKWSQTPAQSRRHNAECSILQLYDSHDAWHVMSAAAMFLSFNMLLTVDDMVANMPRSSLQTF